MNEIVVIGNRPSSPHRSIIDEIPKTKINTLDVTDVSDALVFSSGLYFSKNSKNQTSFKLRGFEQRQITVFLDGIPISLPFDGDIDLSQLGGDDFESIRIIKGHSSILYGANTLGGSINIMSDLPKEKSKLNLRLEGSNHTRIFSSLQYSGTLGELQYLGSIAIEKSPDFKLPHEYKNQIIKRQNSAYEKRSISLRMQYHINPSHKIGINLNYIDNWFHIPTQLFISRPRFWRFPDWKKYVISLNSQHLLTDTFFLRSVIFCDVYHNRLESYDDSNYNTQTQKYAFTSIYNDDSVGFTLYPEFQLFKFGITSGLISFRRDTHREKPAENSPYEKYASSTLVLGIEQHLTSFKNLQTSIGIDVEHLDPLHAHNLPLRKSLLLFNGQFLSNYLITQKIKYFLSTSKKSRFPSLKELYSERIGRNIPNPDLAAEQSLNIEFGILAQVFSTMMKFSFYKSILRDLITNVYLENNTQQLQNIARTELGGLELSVQYQSKNLTVDLNYTYLDAKNTSKPRESDFLEYRPKHHFNFVYHHQFLRHVYIQFEGNFTKDQYYQDPENFYWFQLNDFSLLNIKIGYHLIRYFDVYLRVNNFFDKLYYSELGIPVPGREVTVGMKFTIE